MKRIILIFIIAIAFLCDGYSQSIIWQRLYSGPNGDAGALSICKESNGNFLLLGTAFIPPNTQGMYILKINAYGQTLWDTLIKDSNIGDQIFSSVERNNSCIFTGESDSAFSININSESNLIWHKKYSIPGISFFRGINIISTSDSGFLIAGTVNINTGLLVKLNSSGDLQWYKLHVASFSKTYLYSIELNDGFLITGRKFDSPGNGKGIFTRINSKGDIVWEKDFFLFNNPVNPNRILKLENRILQIGTVFNPSISRSIPYILKTDTSGNIFDTIYIQTTGSKNYSIEDAILVSQNKYLITLHRYGDINPDTAFAEVLIIDSNGVINNSNSFQFSNYSYLKSSQILSNGDVIFSGYADQNGYEQILGIRTDSLLNTKPISINPISNNIPSHLELHQNYPNPFNLTTKIKFEVNKSSKVKLIVYNISGEVVKYLIDSWLTTGSYTIFYNTKDLSSGIYFYTMSSEDISITKKMILVK
jgi:hypothetical protein